MPSQIDNLQDRGQRPEVGRLNTAHRFAWPRKGLWRTSLILLSIATTGLVVFLSVLGSLIPRISTDGNTWLLLQMTTDPAQLKILLSQWNLSLLNTALHVNYVFAICYGVVGSWLLLIAWSSSGGVWKKASLLVLGLLIAGAVADCVANHKILNFFTKSAIPFDQVQSAYRYSVFKFISLLTTTVFLLIFFDVFKGIRAVLVSTWGAIWPIRFPFFVTVILCFFFFNGQALEIFRVIAQADKPRLATTFGIFAAALVSLCSWYFSRLLLDLHFASTGETGYRAWLVRHLPRLLGVSITLSLGIAALCAKTVEPAYHPQQISRLWIIFLTQVSVSILLYFFFWYRRSLINKKILRKRDASRQLQPPVMASDNPFHLEWDQWIPVAIAEGAWLLLLILFTVAPVPTGRFLGPLAVLTIGVGSWIPLGSFLTYAGTVKRVPFLTILLTCAFLFTLCDLNDNHAVRCLPSTAAHKLPTVSEYFRTWLQSRTSPDAKQPYPVFLVAAEGGGIRAAYNTALVLGGLQDSNSAFYDHVFAISGVSGGSIGATVFSAFYKSHSADDGSVKLPHKFKSFKAFAHKTLVQDYLSPVLGMALYPDLLQRFMVPNFAGLDRSRGLEESFEQSLVDSSGSLLTTSYFDWHRGSQQRPGPALLINTTEVGTGKRMMIAPFTFDNSGSGKPLLIGDVADNVDLSLSSAMVLGARFPIITPAGYFLHSEPTITKKHRFVDGGYYENSGAATLLDILAELTQDAPPEVKFYIISIEHNPASLSVPAEPARALALPNHHSKGFDEISPLYTMLNTREARGDDATFELKLRASNYKAQVIDFSWKQGKVPLPLGWYISGGARRELGNQFKAASNSIAQVCCILKGVPYQSQNTENCCNQATNVDDESE